MDHHRLSRKSIDRLATCEPELHKLAVLALKYSPYDFGITEGVRDIDTQRKYVEEGKSQTMNSRHLPNVNGLSEAFDFCVYGKDGLTWDKGHFRKVAQAFIRASIELGIDIEFGGLWQSFEDWPHIQLRERKK